jgi:hypothetical protein
MLTPTSICNTMNAVYETLKTCSVEQIKQMKIESIKHFSSSEYELFIHQCNFAIRKKNSGAWK